MRLSANTWLVNDYGEKMPVEVIRGQCSLDEPIEMTVREVKHHYPRCNGKSGKDLQILLDDIVYRSIPHQMWVGPIKKVIFNDPATIVLWQDGTKTVVKCQEGDTYSKEQGLALCIAKKHLGNKSNFNNEFKRWIQ